MSSPLNAILSGTFTSNGSQFFLDIPSEYTEIELTNLTDIGSTAAATPIMKAWGTSAMTAGQAIVGSKTNGAATIDLSNTIAADGFTFVSDTSSIANGAVRFLTSSATAITAANPAVVLTGDTSGLVANTSVVRVYNTVNMQQIASMDFTIGTIVASTSFQLKHLNASGFAAPCAADGTNAFYRIIDANPAYYPRNRYITAITKAASAVVTLSVTHGYTVGQLVRLNVPEEFGMIEMDGLLGRITAISTANNTITVDIDSTSFTTFAFPTSAVAAAGVSFAQVTPVGMAAISSVANDLDDATDNQSGRGVLIGTGVQTTGKVYQWVARKGLSL